MIEKDWVQVVPMTMLSEADGKLSKWLTEHGIERSQLLPDDIRQDIHRTTRGSESVYFLRRAKLIRLLGHVPDEPETSKEDVRKQDP